MESFYQFDKQWLEDTRFKNNDERMCMMLLNDRMKLSVQSKTFYSDKFKDYFVIYPQAKLADALHVSERKISGILKHLEELGMIIRKSRFNASDLIFLPLSAKSAGTQPQKLQDNNNKHTNNNLNTSNTINTEQPKNKKWNDWARMANQRLGLSLDVVESFRSITQANVKQSYELFTLINNAKKHVINEYGVKGDITRYETNEALDGQLSQQMYTINNLAPKDRNRDKYLMSSYINFFKDAFGLTFRNWLCPSEGLMYQKIINQECSEPKRDDAPIIPMFKIQ